MVYPLNHPHFLIQSKQQSLETIHREINVWPLNNIKSDGLLFRLQYPNYHMITNKQNTLITSYGRTGCSRGKGQELEAAAVLVPWWLPEISNSRKDILTKTLMLSITLRYSILSSTMS
jgi:hypothetical protein